MTSTHDGPRQGTRVPHRSVTMKFQMKSTLCVLFCAALLSAAGCSDDGGNAETASPTVECEELAACCSELASGDAIQARCVEVANANERDACTSVYDIYTGSAQCGAARSLEDSCATLQTQCCDGAAMPAAQRGACEETVAAADDVTCDQAITQYNWLSQCGDTPALRGSSGEGLSLRCCCFRNCADPTVCVDQLFISTCDASDPTSSYCATAPVEPTSDPALVHPYFFYFHDGLFYGMKFPCADFAVF